MSRITASVLTASVIVLGALVVTAPPAEVPTSHSIVVTTVDGAPVVSR